MSGASTALHIVANMSGVHWMDQGYGEAAIQDKKTEMVTCAKELVRWGANIDALDSLGRLVFSFLTVYL